MARKLKMGLPQPLRQALSLCCSVPKSPQLLQDVGILDLVVLGEEQDFGKDFCGLGVLIEERQEDLAALLGVHRHDVDHAAALLVDDAAAQ